jgi:hypothetical protein
VRICPPAQTKIKIDGRSLTLPKYVALLAKEAVTTNYARDYAEDILDLARRRAIIRTADEVAAAAYAGADPDLAERARTAFGEIARARGPGGIKFKLVPFADLKSDPTARTYLIKHVLPRQGLVVVWGPPKCGKSFWVFDAVMHVGIGRAYRGHRVKQGIVVYMALEGQAGFADRKEAFCRRFLEDTEPAPLFHLCGASLDLIREHGALISDIREQSTSPACVVIDTLNRSFSGSESSDEDMTAYVRAADAVQREFGCAVVIIHHCGVNGERPRGHTSLTGAADVQISIRKGDDGIVTTKIEYAKDMAEGTVFSSRLEVEEVGTDPDGDPATSCVVIPVMDDAPAAAPGKPAKMSKAAIIALKALHEAVDACGEPAPVSNYIPSGIRVTTFDHWREYSYRRGISGGETDRAQQKAFKAASAYLISAGRVGVWSGHVWPV